MNIKLISTAVIEDELYPPMRKTIFQVDGADKIELWSQENVVPSKTMALGAYRKMKVSGIYKTEIDRPVEGIKIFTKMKSDFDLAAIAELNKS